MQGCTIVTKDESFFSSLPELIATLPYDGSASALGGRIDGQNGAYILIDALHGAAKAGKDLWDFEADVLEILNSNGYRFEYNVDCNSKELLVDVFAKKLPKLDILIATYGGYIFDQYELSDGEFEL